MTPTPNADYEALVAEGERSMDAILDHIRRCESRPIEGMASFECCPFRAQHEDPTLRRKAAGLADPT
jgi:hypothetical protein